MNLVSLSPSLRRFNLLIDKLIDYRLKRLRINIRYHKNKIKKFKKSIAIIIK
nr:MAG TPA: hypothetical protein [Caudoviricetes sp.]